MDLTQLKTSVEQKRGQFQQLQSTKQKTVETLEKLSQIQLEVEQARTIIQVVSQQTQVQLEKYISDVVTSALNTVFDEPYDLRLEFVQRRNKTEADLYFEQDGNRISPLDASGGGVVNVAAFALRVALLMLSKNNKILFLDEPFHYLHSRILHQRVAQLLSTISKQTGITFIMVTGEEESEEIISKADKVFKVTKKKGISKVEELS